jgi:PAS domain S-box-containing protein
MHRLLLRQLKRHLGLDGDVPENLRAFLEAVNESYEQSDEDRDMLERSLDLSSRELLDANGNLRAILDELEERVRERTAELSSVNEWLMREIAERKVVEARLRESEAMLQESACVTQDALRKTRGVLDGILDSMPSAIIGLDAMGRVTHFNPVAAEFSGWQAHAAPGQPLEAAFPWLGGHMELAARALAEDKRYLAQRQIFPFKGRNVLLDVMIYPLGQGVAGGAVVRLDDVTDRAHLEEIMVQTEKMMTVGGLAAGMAHEINNPLGGIMQSTQVILNRLRKDSPLNAKAAEASGTSMEAVRDYLERREIIPMLGGIREAATRAAHIVAHMLEFSRKSESKRQPTDLAVLIDKSVELSAHDYDLKKLYDFRKISISREYDPSLPPVPCTATQIEQVLVNILRNAAQALSGDNKDDPRITLRTRRDGGMAVIEIEDNGPGMSDEVRRRIFEPFYTTKAPGQGTGLGLSVSYFIVTESHGGTIEAASHPGAGTVFTIRLPLEA